MAVWLGAWNVIAGLVFLVLAMPLYQRRVGRGWYGARFPGSLKSDRNWYAVNYRAGRRFIQLSPVLIAIGLYAVLVPIALTDGLVWMFSLAPVMVAGLVLLDAFFYSERLR